MINADQRATGIDFGAPRVDDPASSFAPAPCTFPGAARHTDRETIRYNNAVRRRAHGGPLTPSLTDIDWYRHIFSRTAKCRRLMARRAVADLA